MSTHVPQNFYRQTVSQDWSIGTGNFYVTVKPTVSSGYMTISPASATLREIVFFTATGTDGIGDYITISLRGQGGTTEQTHIIGETVRMNVGAETIQEIVDDITAIVAAGAVDASTIAKGVTKLSVAPVSASNPIAVGQNDPILAPASYSNYYMSTTESILLFTSDVSSAYCQRDASATRIVFVGVGLAMQRRTIASDWAAADYVQTAVLIGSYLYVLMCDDGATTMRVYRYDKTNLSAGGTLMTTSGQSFGTTGYASSRMLSDDSGNFYFTSQAGNSASQHIVSKYTVSGTVLTFVANTTCGSTSANFDRPCRVDSSTNYYAYNLSDAKIRKYNSSGTLVTTYEVSALDVYACLAGTVYGRTTGGGGEIYNKINL